MAIHTNLLNRLIMQSLRSIPERFIIQRRCYCNTNKNTETPLIQKSLSIAVIGVPNVGKSTLINNIINHRVCPTSCKVHTTRKANSAIYTFGEIQLVFYDTPGMVSEKHIKRHKLEKSFQSSYKYAIQKSDIIAVVHDASNNWTRRELHPTVVQALKAYQHLPSILILNKIDTLKSKRVTLELIRLLTNGTLCDRSEKSKPEIHTENAIVGKNEMETSWNNFNGVFLVSAITGNGLREIQNYFLNLAKERCWKYPCDKFTDETPESLIVDSVRARLLDYLPQEIPYNLQTYLEYFDVDNNVIFTCVEVVCPTKRIERLICGEANGRLRQITERVTSDLVETFGKPVSLTIATRPKEKEKHTENCRD